MKKIIFFLMIIVFFSSLANAISGHISIEYDIMSGLGMTEVDLHKQIDNYTIGLQMNTYLDSFSLKNNWMPAGVPESQFYRGYLKYRATDNIQFSISNQCRHFFSQSHIEWWNDTSSIVIGGKYEF